MSDCWFFFFLRDIKLQNFNTSLKILAFLYKTNSWILDELVNNIQATEMYEFDKKIPLIMGLFHALNQRILKVLRTSQKAFGSVETQAFTVAAWALHPSGWTMFHSNQSHRWWKDVAPSLVYVGNTCVANWKIKQRLAWTGGIMTFQSYYSQVQPTFLYFYHFLLKCCDCITITLNVFIFLKGTKTLIF